MLYEADGGKRVHCTRCNISHSMHSPYLKHWLNSKCHAIGSAIDRPIPFLFHAVHIKNESIHFSHKLYKYIMIYITAKLVGHMVGIVRKYRNLLRFVSLLLLLVHYF